MLDLTLALVPHVHERRLGEVWISPLDVILDAERALIVQPDLFFISNERSHILSDRVRGAPDLVVEVLSPSPRIGKLGERIGWFQEYGVKECWLIHQQEHRIEVLNFIGTNAIDRASFDNRTAHSIAGAARFRSHSRVDAALGVALSFLVGPSAGNSGDDDLDEPPDRRQNHHVSRKQFMTRRRGSDRDIEPPARASRRRSRS